MTPMHTQSRLRRVALGCAALALAVIAVGPVLAQGNGGGSYNVNDAKQDIEELRRLYAIATDLLGLEDDPKRE